MPNKAVRDATTPLELEQIGDRYEVVELLGRGGMACVYRVKDRVTGRELALKQLVFERGAAERSVVASLFEREFHTLTQLRHPHVIAVYDYGLSADDSPYYTMELLDGGDLRDRAPLPWREVCRLLFDVCSSLALLHSRRLLHRDISPRNIRCTQEGRAKLIDFGAMAPMSAGGADVVGTPAFVAPETLHRMALDARTDLFSLGATLYHALTGRLPYQARTFSDVVAAWSTRVVPPSTYTPDVPAALDDLTLSLISVEPALRPQSAFEVMQRLAAIAGLQADESEAVSRAYLATPSLVGRADALQHFREKLLASRLSRGGALLIEGRAGVGRSRFLDACALDAKALGFTVLRAKAGAAREAFGAVHALTQHLLEALPFSELDSAPAELFVSALPAAQSRAQGEQPGWPALKNFAEPGQDPDALQQALCSFWLRVSQKHPLLIAVDDVERIDSGSAAVLAALLNTTRRAGIFVVLSAANDEPASDALAALARRCNRSPLGPLTRKQTRELLGSLFGEVSNIDMLAHEIHEVALGNPRQSMDMAQHLVDRGVIRYAAGTWTLPSRLAADDLPRSSADAMRARIEALSPNARFLAETQAIAFSESLRDQDYRALLPAVSTPLVEQAISELLATQILSSDGASYTLTNRLWTAALSVALDPEQLPARHRALAAMYESSSKVAFIYHAFAGGMDERGHAALAQLNAGYAKRVDHEQIFQQNTTKMMQCYPRALESAQQLGMSPRAINDLRRWRLAGNTTMEDEPYPAAAGLWLAQLERDTGLDLYRADPDASDPMQRLMRALQAAQERYLATPERERAYSVEEAIPLLAEYVVYCIVIGARSHDATLLRSLPPLLEPFAALSPVLDAIWNNARALEANQCEGKAESARERWLAVLAKLDTISQTELNFVKEIANAVAFAVGNVEAQLGLPSATTWADRLDRDPYQKISALQLRRIVRLEQGDWKGAERLRRQIEVLTLQSRGPQMFKSLLVVELAACARAGDLVGVQNTIERIQPIAARFPSWIPNLLYGEACFHLVRGDYEAAKLKCEECIALTQFDARGFSTNTNMWLAAKCALSEALLALDRAEDARTVAAHALEVWLARTGKQPVELVRALALAEAKLGESNAAERLETSIAEQNTLGVTGLQLGLSYEARAQIAIWQQDTTAFDRYALLTAREYRYGADSALGARYARLINEAGRLGRRARNSLADFATSTVIESGTFANSDMKSFVSRTMARTRRSEERAQAALQLLCASRTASAGHLYLASPGGLVLSASQGNPAPKPALDALQAFLAQTRDHAEEIDDMVTGELLEEATPSAIVEAEGVSYVLLPLICLVDDESTVAGVAAIALSDAPVDALRQGQLLNALATHLLETGEYTGVTISH
jgi:ABC-type transporter Mla MlaB component